MSNDLMNTSSLQNNDVTAYGLQAVKLWKQGDKGDAVATFCLWIAHHTITFQAYVRDKKGAILETLTFDLHDMNRHSVNYRDCRNEDGSRNIKAVNARTIEVASRIFGLTDPTVAQKQRIDRALEIVAGFERMNLSQEAVTLSARNELVVPYVVMNAEPDKDKATTNELNAYERLRDSNTALDGKDGQSLAALKRRLSPPQTKGADERKTTDKVVSFVNSIKFLSAVMASRNDETGEDTAADGIPAFSNEIDQMLFTLSEQINAYRALSQTDTGEIEAPKTGTNG